MRTYYVVDPSPLTKAGEHIVSDGTMMTFFCLKPLGPLSSVAFGVGGQR